MDKMSYKHSSSMALQLRSIDYIILLIHNIMVDETCTVGLTTIIIVIRRKEYFNEFAQDKVFMYVNHEPVI